MQSKTAIHVVRASHLGMCFGVRDAISLALEKSAQQPLTVFGDLVHNETVLAQLQERGIRVAREPDQISTSTVMITAHGASDRAREALAERGLEVVEATCPLVRHAHRAVAQLLRAGFHPIVVGQSGHAEVRGLTEDLPAFDVVLTEEEVRRLEPRTRFGVVAQTTQPIERVRRLVECLREQFPAAEVRFIDTVCQPTKQRQAAALELAQVCNVVVVVGGANSNNTRELVNSCRKFGARVHHVQSATDLQREWFDGAATVGLTAGTSTPDPVIDAVEAWLRHEM